MSDYLEQMRKVRYFEDKYRNEATVSPSPSPHRRHHSDKNCCCGGHSANDGDKQYKGRQWQKRTKAAKK